EGPRGWRGFGIKDLNWQVLRGRSLPAQKEFPGAFRFELRLHPAELKLTMGLKRTKPAMETAVGLRPKKGVPACGPRRSQTISLPGGRGISEGNKQPLCRK